MDKELVLWSVAQLRPKERLGKVLMNPDYNDFQKRFNGCARDGNSENKDGHLQWCLLRLLLRWALKLCSVQSDVNLGHGNNSPPPRIATLFLFFCHLFFRMGIWDRRQLTELMTTDSPYPVVSLGQRRIPIAFLLTSLSFKSVTSLPSPWLVHC